MKTLILVVLLVVVSVATASVTLVPFWISPKNITMGGYSDRLENFVAPKNEWADVPGGIGVRYYPSVHFDSKGILWIYSGSTEQGLYLNAGWNYDLVADEYRWVVGSDQESTQLPPNYGTMGIESPDVFPGLIYGQASVIDSKDQIWIYSANRLFRWNTTSGNFAWIGGGQDIPNMGTSGQPSEDVWPGFVDGPSMVLDSQDNFWLIGGVSYPTTTNMVWQYNTTSGYWTFVYGDPFNFTANDYEQNIFGGRTQFACDIDENDLIWVHGGLGNENFSVYWSYGDLWTFDTKSWMWSVVQESTIDSAQVVEIRNEFSENNRPGSRFNHRMVNRLDGTLMMYGGGHNTQNYFYYDDWWLFDMTLKQWKIIGGGITIDSPTPPTYADHFRELGAEIGYRQLYGLATGKTNKGQFVLLGGVSTTALKDVWIVPQDVCALDLADCHPQATCSMDEWQVVCTCQDGYVGDGKTCEIPAPVAPVTPMAPMTPVNSNTPSTVSGSVRNVPVSAVFGVFSVLCLALLS